jgi:hypothetical protein
VPLRSLVHERVDYPKYRTEGGEMCLYRSGVIESELLHRTMKIDGEELFLVSFEWLATSINLAGEKSDILEKYYFSLLDIFHMRECHYDDSF